MLTRWLINLLLWKLICVYNIYFFYLLSFRIAIIKTININYYKTRIKFRHNQHIIPSRQLTNVLRSSTWKHLRSEKVTWVLSPWCRACSCQRGCTRNSCGGGDSHSVLPTHALTYAKQGPRGGAECCSWTHLWDSRLCPSPSPGQLLASRIFLSIRMQVCKWSAGNTPNFKMTQWHYLQGRLGSWTQAKIECR